MATDPVPALIDLAKATPDPRAIANWLNAYLGTRPHDAKLAALKTLELAFSGGAGGGTDPKATAMILRIVRRTQEELGSSGKRRK